MINDDTHMVQKLTLDLTIPDRTSAWEIQNRFSQFCHLRLGHIMDKVIHDVAQTEEHLHIDRMEINLKELSSHGMEEDFQEKFEQKFSELLKQHISEARHKASCKEKTFDHPDNSFLNHSDSDSSLAKDHFLSHDDHWLTILQLFLETGTLPWFAIRLQAEGLETIITGLVNKQPDKTRSFFQKQLKKPTPRRRFVLQFEWTLLKKVIFLVATPKPSFLSEDLDSYLEAIEKITPLFFPQASVGKLFWEAAVETAMEGTPGETFFQQVLLKTIHGLSPDDISQKIQILTAIEREVTSASAKDKVLQERLLSPFPPVRNNIRPDARTWENTEFLEQKSPFSRPISKEGTLYPGLEKDKQRYNARVEKAHPMDPLPGSKPFAPEKNDQTQTTPDMGPRPGTMVENLTTVQGDGLHAIGQTTEGHGPVLDTIYIENAGLVIIWPYLGRFFETIGFTEDGKFKTEAQRAKAVILLQYLASGQRTAPEFHLPLNKLLCGWDLASPIQKEITIPNRARQESQTLIKTVIKHWDALKSTSPETFQTSFFQRNGVLERTDHNWRLRVEKKPYDMLLERLPWSISMIRLSWMTTLLQVEW
ncbi:conserved hypothetical protein [Desulforapulum autotrophicum HRM2]|uniref:Uncharacterized protein n=1 Tax=Desulforapulum autotrophicum (strain ATCC 43914 / DSM 3382 / VKM B-1955 / HRM2) TaxID=177437 RepID=C0Q8S9_DESAH|nr:contractile injection system tape measure protein [Desulforapulum autotrophicum]ACN14419.1 conserved hypothetical protein [Desulforapulum autotrophicum HRM2]